MDKNADTSANLLRTEFRLLTLFSMLTVLIGTVMLVCLSSVQAAYK